MNFRVEISDKYGHKHLYTNETLTMQSLLEEGHRRAANDPLIVLLIIRSPEQWVMAMYENCHDHLHSVNKTFLQFLETSPFLTYDFTGGMANANLIDEDGMYREDVFALRTMKLRAFKYLIEKSKSIPSMRVSLTRFEDVTKIPYDVLCQIWQELHLPTKRDRAVAIAHDARAWSADINAFKHKINSHRRFFNSDSVDTIKARNLFCSKVDWDIEEFFGYRSSRGLCVKP